MPHATDFCKFNSPVDLQTAIIKNTLAQWCKENPDRLQLALDCINIDCTLMRQIVMDAIDAKHREDVTTHLKALREPHWTVVWTFCLVILSILIAILAWWFPRSPVDAPAEIGIRSPASIQSIAVPSKQQLSPIAKPTAVATLSPTPAPAASASTPTPQASIPGSPKQSPTTK